MQKSPFPSCASAHGVSHVSNRANEFAGAPSDLSAGLLGGTGKGGVETQVYIVHLFYLVWESD